jgi:gliding motility-associated-like protein
MNLLKHLVLGLFLFTLNFAYTQITDNGASTTQSTVYTDGSPNDVIYIYCIEPNTTANIGSLTANPPGGAGPWDFDWFIYNSGTNAYDPLTNINNQASSTINNLATGGYSVSITDNGGNVVGCYNTWVFCNETNLDAGNIGASCGGFNLGGVADPIADFIYYNPPPDQFIIDANTQITVCFDATHTYVSDIGFFLISPAGNVITLSPNPQAINAANGCCCNNGNNLNDLCFTTVPSGGLFVCGAAVPLTGTFSSFEGNVIDWSPIYGENASAAGWTVQIFDCIGGDAGALTNATISFVGNSVCGPETIIYDSGNINSPIADNSCDQGTASSFIVPPSPLITTPIVLANSITSFNWTSDNPCVTIPNANASLNPAIASTPTQDTWFYLTSIDNFGCTFTDSVQFIRNCPCNSNSPFILLSANAGNLDCVAGTFDMTGQIQFDDGMAPCTGTLTITNCSGDDVVFNAPFTSPINYTIPGIAADGTAGCTVSAQFSADPELCTIVTNIFTEPDCPCNIDAFNATIGSCNPADNNYTVDGGITFTNPPAPGGFLTITVDNGTTTYDTIINAANYASPMTWSISGIDSDGANITVSAVFSLDNTCSVAIASVAPINCYCSAAIGTFTTSMNGASLNNYVLCFGDDFSYTSNGDYTNPDDVNANSAGPPPVNYEPGIGYLIYSCPPTPGLTPDNNAGTGDPCLEGLILTGTGNLLYNDLNDLGWINAYPPGTFTNNIIYYVPVTMYDITNGWYSVAIEPCYELGPAIAVQYLPEIKTTEVEDCQNGTVTSTIIGGIPEFDGSNYSIVPGSLVPANASFVNTTAPFNGTITITGLTNGQVYSYDILDLNGCPVLVTGTFIGTEDPGFNYSAYTFCTADADPTVNITGDAGSFTFTVTSGGPSLILNGGTGAIDLSASDPGVYEITFTTNDPICFSDSTITMNIAATPTVDPIIDQTICDGTDFTFIDFTGSAGSVFNWANDNVALGLAANGTNDISIFTGVNGTGAQISSLITVTPSAGSCIGTPTTFNLFVDPLDNSGFSYPLYSYCTAEADPTAVIDVPGGAFTYSVISGGPTLTLNGTIGLIGLGSSNAGSYDITYTTTGICPQDSTINMNIASTPTVNPVIDTAVCVDANFSFIDFTGSAGSVFNWTNDNANIGLGANGNGDISSFLATNNTGAQISGLITVTPSAGSCIGTPTTFTLFVDPLDNPGFNFPQDAYCTNDANPSANMDVVGGVFTFAVVSGGPNIVIDGSTGLIDLATTNPGVYLITYTTQGICDQDSTITMTINLTPTVDPVLDTTLCHGFDFSNITFTGVGSQTYDWTNDNVNIGLAGNGTGDIIAFTGNNPGAAQITGLITVTPNTATCTGAPITFNLNVDPLDDPGFSYPQYTYCTADANPTPNTNLPGGIFSAFTTAGGGTITIDPNTGIINLATSNPGTFNITYTTNGICPEDSTVSFIVSATPFVNTILNDTVCENSSFIGVNFTGPAGTTFDWVNDNALIGLAANGSGNIPTFTGLTSGGQEIATITVTPITGSCIGSDSTFNLVVNPLDNPGFSYPNYSYCTTELPNPTATINVFGGTFTYSITNGGPTLNVNPSSGLIDLVTSNEGIYELTYTTNGLCPQDSTVTITIHLTPTIDPLIDVTVCHGDDFNITPFNGTSGINPTIYNWTNDNVNIGLAAAGNGDVTQFSATNGTNGQITGVITVTPSTNECTGTPTSFNLSVNPLDDPSFEYANGLTYCVTANDPVALITGLAGGTFSYTVNSNGPNLGINVANGNIDLANSNSGSYDITYTTNGICPQSSTLTLVITDAPIANFSFAIYCTEDNDPMPEYEFDDQGFPFPNIGSGGIFSEPTGNLSINPATGQVDLSSSATGTYTITNTINLAGCSAASATEDITIYPMPTATVSNDITTCPDDSFPAILVFGIGSPDQNNDTTFTLNYEYNANIQAPIFDSSSPITLPNLGYGTYEITSIHDGYCTSAISIIMVVDTFETPSINAMPNYTVCEGDNLIIDQFTGSSVSNSYDWNILVPGLDVGFGTSGTGNINPTIATNPQLLPINISVVPYSTNTTAESPLGCVGDTIYFNVMVNPLPGAEINADNLTGCEPTTIVLNDLIGTGSTYEWTFGNGETGTGNPTSINYENAGIFDIGLTVTSNYGCISTDFEAEYINITPTPVASFSFNPNETDVSHTEITFTNSSIDGDTYTWDFGDETALSSETDPIHTYINEPDQYTITLIVSNNNGLCSDIAEATIIINDIILFYVPNIFTPDNDDYNEIFKPIFTSGFDPLNYHLMIFNRWGELIFESYNASIGWDGTYTTEDKLVQDGVYVWKIEFKETMSDKRHTEQGHVTLLK